MSSPVINVIGESSSTRTEWTLVEGENVLEHAFTEGLNPFFHSRREISHSIRLELPEAFFKRRWNHVYYYGAGCSSPEKNKIVEASLVAQFKTPVTVESDLLGAARGLLVHEPGLACILGTGSNSCFYDGQNVVKNVRSLGFILGDEGSGAVLGKILVGDVLKKQLPEHICEAFLKEYDLDRTKIITAVYRQHPANRFLAQFAPFLQKNMDEPAVHDLVVRAFTAFFQRNVASYDNYKNLPCNFVGSIAFYQKKALTEAAEALGITIGTIIQAPMEGLIKYHSC
mgnify:CR=1 FL=1